MKKKFIALTLSLSALFLPQSVGCYTAKSGDTFWKIAKAHGVSLQSVLSANGKTEQSVLEIGDTVLIPGEDVHIVKSGDTYWKLSKEYGISFKELLSLNGADENTGLFVGQVIKLKGEDAKELFRKTLWRGLMIHTKIRIHPIFLCPCSRYQPYIL